MTRMRWLLVFLSLTLPGCLNPHSNFVHFWVTNVEGHGGQPIGAQGQSDPVRSSADRHAGVVIILCFPRAGSSEMDSVTPPCVQLPPRASAPPELFNPPALEGR